MARLESVSIEGLQTALDAVDKKHPTLRITSAIAHKRGVSQTELATWFDVERKTIYNWLKRLESADSLVKGARDNSRSGRPRRLPDQRRVEVREVLQNPPEAAGYDGSNWTPPLLKRLLAERWDVTYSESTCRRLFDELM